MSKVFKNNPQQSKLILEELEERRLFSGGIEGLIASDLDSDANAIYREFELKDSQAENTDGEISAAEQQSQEIVFIDAGVDNYQQLVDDLRNNADSSRNIEVVVLDRDKDGIEEISEFLSHRENLDAIHIISHGSDGSVELGNTSLNADTLEQNNLKIALWANNFADTGDILIYGCNLAETGAGQSLINDLSALTLTDVAASTDLTGHASQGGDWALEFSVGQVESKIAVSAELQQEYQGTFATYTVTSLADSGAGSLREAITLANSSGGADTIEFGVVGTINLSSALPSIGEELAIDGSTAPGYSGDPVVNLDGSGVSGNGLRFTSGADNSSVNALMITNFTGNGIQVDSGADGIAITGNWIGTTGTGTTGDGNSNNGINVQGANTVIGGIGANDGNVITNNGNEGINLTGTGATGTLIQGNIIGLDPDGSTGTGNGDVGIALLSGSHNTTIGGTDPNAGNIISMNFEGIEINSNNNTIQGNYIGTDITGTLDRGNDSDDGIEIQNNATGNLIGGTDPGAGNLIAFNALDGVNIVNGSGNAVIGNDIHSNGDQEIDLGAGANSDQAAPVLASTQTTGAEVTISGSLSSTANSYFRIEFFGSNQTYLGFVNVATDGTGNATFDTTLTASVASGTLITSTATKSDASYSIFTDTSAFASTVVSGNAGTAIWRDASTTPQTSDWNGSSFGSTVASAPSGDYRIMQGAEAPTRDEIIIIGVDESSQINGEIWDGSSWSVLPGSLGSPLGTVGQNYWWGMDVQYESQSGDALMVWTDGANIEYATWDGSSWSGVNTISYSGATPRQLQLAASPNSDEMVLVVSDSSSEDFALVWNGSNWGNEQILEQVAGDDRTDVYVAYEQQSGHAMVVYGKTGIDAYYRIWNGTGWESEGSVSQAVGASGNVRWTTLASDLNSDQIALGVVTSGGDVWLNVWDGSGWGTSELATTNSTGTNHPSVSVAFESTSGNLLAVYGESGSSTVKYQTWTVGGGWSGEQIGPDIGGTPNSLMLAADPISDQIMLSAQDSNSDVNYVLWDGSSWGTPTELGTSTTETKNQPFLFLWDQNVVNNAPVFIDSSIGYWGFDEGSGDNVAEGTVGVSAGTLGSTSGADTNDPTWTTGKFGQALHFDGVNDYVEIADAPGLDISGPEFSASFWMNPDSGPNQEDMLFMKGDRQGNINYYLSWKNSNEMTWAFKDGAGWHYQDMPVTMPTTGQWNHIGISFDRPTVSLYVNGTKYVFDDIATGGSMDRDLTANNEVLWIGAGRDGGSLVGVNQWSGPFTGSIDELALFDRALTDADMEAIRTGTPPVVTASAFSIDENSANNTVVGTVAANDPDVGDTLSYAITAGNTGGAFSIDANGQITVANSSALDFETTPVFNLTVEATDDGMPAKSATTGITISLNNINDAPIVSATALSPTWIENGGPVNLFNTTSVDLVESGDLVNALSIDVTGLADSSNEILMVDGHAIELTDLNSETTAANGYAVSVSAPGSIAAVTISRAGGFTASEAQTLIDGLAYDNTSDTPQGAGRIATLVMIQDDGGTANGGSNTTVYNLDSTVTVVATNDAPVITSDGGGDTAVVVVPESTTVVTTVRATDPELDSPTFSITGGADAGLFSIDSNTGVLSFVTPPNYEGPGDNSYQVIVTADDGNGGSDVQTITVNVTNLDPIANGAWFDETNGGGGYADFASLVTAHNAYLGSTEQTIDFESLTEGDVLSNQFTVSHGITFSNTGINESQIYAEGGPWIQDVSGYDGSYAADGSNVYLKMANDDPASPFTIDFASPVSKVGAMLGMGKEGADHSLQVRLYDSGGNLLDEQTLEAELWEASGTFQNYETFLGVSYDSAVISKIEILNSANINYANALIVDQLQFSTTPDVFDEFNASTGIATVTGNVLANDIDPAGGTLTISGFSQGASGSVVYNNDGTFTYTSNASFTGTDTFTYTIADGQGGTDTAIVTMQVGNAAPQMTAWFNDAWDTRKELTVSSTQVAGDVTNFPVLITLNADAELAAQALANGDDIVFTAADGVTQLAHEIEYFDETTGELRVWIKTDLSSSVDTDIYMYFGNAASGPQENVAGVWDNYVGVYHLGEQPDGTPGDIVDSSGSGNHGTTEGAMDVADSVSTTIGQGLAFDGTNDKIRIPNSASLDGISDEATFSLWINYVDAADGQHQIVMTSEDRFSDTDGYEWASNGAGEHFFYPDATTPDGNYNVGVNPFTNGDWHHLAATMDFATKEVKIYVDGSPMPFSSEGVPGNWTTTTTSTADLLWGGNPDRAERFFLGMMDEIRIADVARSQEWLQTEYNNQKPLGTFFSVGTSEDREDKLTDINEDDFTSAGDSVLTIINSSGADRITDDDSGAVEGVAVTAVDDSNGTWQYDANADGTWLAFGAVSDANAVLLDTGALIRFVPNADYNGSAGDLTFHAWDQTSGTNGDTGVDISTNGGSTAYSSETFDATLNVLPVADVPSFGGADTGAVQEDVAVVSDDISTSGTLTITDPDAGESSFQAATINGLYGDLVMQTNGDWTYTADNTQVSIQQLDVGESVTDTLTVTSFDGTTHNVVITINGSEDAAVISGTTTGTVTEDGTLTSSGTLTISDTDTSDTPGFADVGVTAGDNAYGNFVMTAGTWTYTLDNNHVAVQALDVGETLSDTHTFTATDGSTQQVTITIYGAEDAPVFDSTAVTAATEDIAYSYTITTSDVDVESVTITAPTLPAWLTFVDNGDGTATLSGTPTNAEVGSHNVALTVSDGTLSSNQNFTIVVGNTNDPAVIGGVDTDAVQEDVAVVANNISTSGTLTITDPDTGESSFQAGTINGTYGDLVMQTNGDWTYTADNTQAAIQQLDALESVTDTLTVTSFDGTTHNVVITINGSEDAAVITGTTTGSVTEDGTLTSSGTLSISDTDTSDTPSFTDVPSTVGDNGYGSFVMTAGTWTYTLDNNHVAVQALDVGETLTDTRTFAATDGSTQQVTITINGAEDAPVFDSTAVTSATEDVVYSYTIATSDVDVESVTITAPTLPAWLTFVDNGNGTATLSGTPTNAEVGSHNVLLNVSDGTLSSNQNFIIVVGNTNDPAVIGGVDTGAVQEDVAVAVGNIGTSGSMTIADPDVGESSFVAATINGAYGDLVMQTNGNWTYTADNTQAAIQQLDVSESLTDTLTVTSFDGTTHNVVITINGSEDAAVTGGTASGSVTEDGSLTVTDALTITDIDASDNPVNYPDVAPTPGANGYGNFEITGNTWTYTLTNGHASVQALDVGETLTDSYTFLASDGSSQLVTVTINGAEDTPTLDNAIVDQTATEDAAFSFTFAASTFGDLDTSDTLAYSATLADSSPLPGWLNFDAATRTFSGTPANADVGPIDIRITADDGSSTVTDTFTLTVLNVDDAPLIGGDDTGTVTEDVGVIGGVISTTGSLTITDPDAGESSFQTATVNGSYGDLTIDISGNWIYDANNNQSAIQALDAGQSMTDTLTVSAFDGTTHDIVITLNGTEDSAVIGGTAVGAVTEDSALVVSDTLMITDVDSNDNPISFNDVAATPGSNGYGSFEMTGNTWTYTLNNSHASVQALDVGETLTDTYTFAASDGSTQVVTVTINGSEDAPVIGGTATGAVSEDGVLAASATLTISDTDSSDNPISFNDVTPTAGVNGYGSFEMSGNTWTYTLNNSHASVQALDVGETLTDLFTFSASDGSTRIVTVTIGGAEDAPTLDNAIADQTANEDLAFNFTFATNTFGDLDTSDTLIYSATLADSSPLPGWLNFDAATRTFSGMPADADVGQIDIRITADDGSSTVTDTFTLTVLNANDAPLIGGVDSGQVNEDESVSGGKIATSGALTIADPDAGESSFVGSTVNGALGALTIDTAGNWSYSADNGNPEIQALQSGESITDTLTVTTVDGTTHDVVITINGVAEAAPPPPPPVVEPPIVEPPPEAEPPPEEETETGGGVDPVVDDIVRAPQDVTPPAVQEEADYSGYLQQEEAEADKARYSDQKDKPAVKIMELPQAQAIQQQAIQQQNLSLNELSLQVSDDETLNEKYELELLARIDSMHSGMDGDAAQTSADDVDVQIVMGSTASLTAGIVSWVLRGGSLLASFMSTVPLLNRFDPLPILKSREEDKDVEEDTDDDGGDTQFRKHQKRVDKLFSAKDNAREQNGYMND